MKILDLGTGSGYLAFPIATENAGCKVVGLVYADSFDSSIRFPKKKDTATGYEQLLTKHDKTVIESYSLAETETELFITEQVNNILFVK